VKNIFIKVRSNTYDAPNLADHFLNMEVREDLFSRRFCSCSPATGSRPGDRL